MLTALEMRSVRVEVQNQYQGYYQKFENFLPGAKVGVATSKTLRRHSCRLLGRDVLGRQDRSRRRESGCLGGVHAHRPQGQAAKKQACTSRVAKRKSTWQSSSSTEIVGSRDGYEVGSEGEDVGSVEAVCRPRHIHTTSWRVHRLVDGKRRCPTRQKGGASVSLPHVDHQRPRGQEGRQSGDLRQLYPLQLPQSGVLRGAPSSACKELERSKVSSLSFHSRRVSKDVHPGRGRSRHSGSAPLSDTTRRCFGGSQYKRARFPIRQVSRSVADRPVGEAVWEVREGAAASQPFITRQSGILSMVAEKPGESAKGSAEPPQSMSGYGWEDVFTLKPLPHRFSLELFAGTARITSSLNGLGHKCYPIDCCLFPSHNVLDISCWAPVDSLDTSRSDSIHMAWYAMHKFQSCKKVGWFGARATAWFQQSVGVQMAFRSWQTEGFSRKWSCCVFPSVFCLCVRSTVFLMHWKIHFLAMLGACRQWNSSFNASILFRYTWIFVSLERHGRNPHRFWEIFRTLSNLQMTCHSQNGVCSASLRPHVRLTGTDASGTFMTLKAQPYPLKMAQMVAERVSRSIS